MKFKIIWLLSLILFASCSPRNLAYLSDLKEQGVYREKVTNSTEPQIQPDDLLSISVVSLNPESNSLFNRGEMPAAGIVKNYNASNASSAIYKEGYLVDKEGFIDFPVLGKVKIGGLSKAEAKAKLTAQLENYLKEPIVNIRYLNYRITVVGEVNNPSTFTIPSEKINILEALGMAGDMTAYGKRENVLIIREVDDVRTVSRLNLNSKDVLSSPYFYLQQNDVVYVEPDKVKHIQASTNTRMIAVGGTVLSLILFALRIF
jgi:polysaccharide export outer membrane protein